MANFGNAPESTNFVDNTNYFNGWTPVETPDQIAFWRSMAQADEPSFERITNPNLNPWAPKIGPGYAAVGGGLPPLPPGFVVEEQPKDSAPAYDPMKDILSSGFDFTNGYRTQQDIEDLRRHGYTPAEHSRHLEGDAIDLVPGKSGKTMADVERFAQSLLQKWGGNGRVIPEGDHIHLQLDGWGQAPGTPNTPYSGLPDLPDGFQVEQRGSVSKADLAKPTTADANDPTIKTEGMFADEAPSYPGGAMEFHDAVYKAMASHKVTTPEQLAQFASDYNKANGTDFAINVSDPQTLAALSAANHGGKFGVAVPRMTAGQTKRLEDRIAETKAGASMKGASTVLGAEDTVTFGADDEIAGAIDAASDWLDGKPFDLTGNINANRDYIDTIRGEHPNYYIAGQLGGALLIPAIGAEADAVSLAKAGAAGGAAYGFNESDGTLADRASGAAVGAVTGAVAAPIVGKAFEVAGSGISRLIGTKGEKVAADAAPIPDGFEVEDPGQSAAMAADRGPSVSGEVPTIRPAIAPGTPEQRAVAATATPESVTAPVTEPLSRAGNINLSRIETPEDIDAMMKFTTDTFDGFKGERRGVQSWEATSALAKDLGMSPDELLARRTGEAYNAEQALAARNLLAASASETRKLADSALNGSEEDKAAFVKSFLLHAAITEKASGAAAEAGRALNIYRKVAQASLGDTQAMQEAIRRLQAGASVDDVAEMVRSLADDPAALNRFARDAVKPTLKDKLLFVWINSLLSGPKTHIVNMTSNLVTAAMDVPEQATAAAIGKVRQTLGGKGDAILGSEIGPRFYGMVKGAADSLAAAKEGFSKEAGGKIDAPRPAIGGRAGDIISIPTRLLNAEDEFFKAMAKRSELAGLAVRKANSEGLTGPKLKARIEQLMANPTDDMMTTAADAALYKTYQRPLGPAMQSVSNALQKAPVLRLFVPFIRTPTNLLKYAIERTPAAPLLKEVRAEFVAGGAKRDLAIARMTLGTGLSAIVAGMASQGKITGNGPADPSAKRALEADGWQPYSIRIGNEWVSYRRLDPWATVIGTAADAVELQSAMTDKQSQDAGAIVIGAMTQNLASKTWLSGLSDLLDAVTDPQQNAKNVITRLGSSIATPSLVAQIEGAVDPAVRDTSDPSYMGQLRKKIEARIPGMSSNVIPKRDILGKEVKSEQGPLARLLSPYDTRQLRRDPVAKAIYDSGARFSLPSRQVGGGRLPDKDYDAYQQVAAQKFYDAMKETLASSDWEQMDRAERAKLIEKIKNSSRKEARSELFGLDH
jgi:hypothetical protein